MNFNDGNFDIIQLYSIKQIMQTERSMTYNQMIIEHLDNIFYIERIKDCFSIKLFM